MNQGNRNRAPGFGAPHGSAERYGSAAPSNNGQERPKKHRRAQPPAPARAAAVDDPGPSFEDDWVRRVIVKFRDDVTPPEPPSEAHDYVASAAALEAGNLWDELRDRFHVSTIARYTSLSAEEVQTATDAARAGDSSYQPPNFLNYFAVTVPSDVTPDDIVAHVRGWDGVELAEVEPHFTDGAGFPTGSNPRLGSEGFLDAAPAGVDARAAWAVPGGTGSGVKFIDVEQGWLLDHEDLAAAAIPLMHGQNWTSSRPHGTSAMGIVMMQDNDLGGVGIGPACSASACGCRTSTGTYDLLGAILAATNALDRGDVMLVEQQAIDGTNPGPVEASDPIFNAIRTAVAKGIIVVEAGGNGGTDLDSWRHPTKGLMFKRGHADFKDSGAILVGACSSATPHTRLSFSSTGSRIDCWAWGENVDTATTDGSGARDQYTTSFGGTSSATPIISGVAIVFQGMVRARALMSISPADMRAKLSNSRNGTPAATNVMPDLKKLIANEVLALLPDDGVPRPHPQDQAAALAFFDAGHGGEALYGGSSPHGARGPRGTREKDVNLAIARAAQARFGARAVLSRSGDYNLSLRDRVEAARRSGAPVFVGLHANSGPAHKRGAEVWVYGGGAGAAHARSLQLARSISAELAQIDGAPVPVKVGELATLSPANHGRDVAACIVEADYITNSESEARLRRPQAVDAIGAAVARGVRRYLGGYA
jgi:N-acetylmuramoyl-L-alanine amidase